MLKSILFQLLCIFSTPQLFAQNRIITGTLKDKDTKTPIAYCNVIILNTSIGTISDENGRFKLAIPENLAAPKLAIAIIGYKKDTISCSNSQNEFHIFLSLTHRALNEVVVTGVSRATLIRENPVSIVSISSKAIEQTTESNIIDVLVKNAPGLNAVKTGPNISKPFIRGLGYNRVLVLYDGIRQEGQQWGDEHGIEVDAYNIARAEVIKGPASLMFGSDALAGVVGLISAMPMDTSAVIHGKVFSEYQSNNGLVGNGFRITYGKSHWSYAIRGSHRVAKNYYNNIDGPVYNTSFQETNFSTSIQRTCTNGVSNLNFTLYNNLQGIPDGSRDSLTRKFTKQIYEGGLDDIKHRPLVSSDELNSYSLSPLHQLIQHYRLYSNNHYRVGKGDFDFLYAWQQNVRREYNHPTAPEQAGMYVQLNTLNYGLRYNLPRFLNTESSIGVNGMYQNNLNKNATNFPIPNYNLFDAGTYMFLKWRYKELTVSGGTRLDIRYLKANDFYVRMDSVSGFTKNVSSSDTTGAYLQFPNFDAKFKGFSASIGTTLQISERYNMKVNIARGYRAPNITEFASNGLDPGAHIVYLGNRNFVPEFSWQEDIGIDGHFDNYSASLSLFNNTIYNYIYLAQLTDLLGNSILDSQGNKTYKYQQASAQIYGLETSLLVHPKLLKGFAFDNSLCIVYAYNRKVEYKNAGIKGEYLPLIPPLKILSSISQDVNIKSKIVTLIKLKAEIDFTGTQNRFLALKNTETVTLYYNLLNVSLSSTINYTKKSALQLQFQINNVFDRAYQSNLSRLKYFEYYTASPNGNTGIYGMGRNICIKAIIPF